MFTYTIYLGAAPIASVRGTEAAYACFEAAKTLAEFTGKEASLVWDETGEEVACFSNSDEEEDEYYEYDDEDLELGFDPYCGCYTDDC